MLLVRQSEEGSLVRRRVVVVGGGVIGLTCAVVLARQYDVTLVADTFGVNSPSVVATAIWHIYLVDPNDQRTLRWSQLTLETLVRLSHEQPLAGVRLVAGTELFRRGEPTRPPWHHIPPSFNMMSPTEILAYPGVAWGYRITAPVADMAKYLNWLQNECIHAKVTLIERRLGSIDEAFDYAPVVINCTGFGARALLGDAAIRPVRGQYLVVSATDGAPTEYLGDDHHPEGTAYVIPREDGICIGGTEEFDQDNIEFTESLESLAQRAGQFLPWILDVGKDTILKRVVGLRPYREGGVRLELEYNKAGQPIIHNYGHGGSGFSLAWGCAETVVELIRQVND
jgi:D-amino-acid oxidase